MNYAKLSALELEMEIKKAEYYSEDSGPELFNALSEIERLRSICRNIIDEINSEAEPSLTKIDILAHEYFIG